MRLQEHRNKHQHVYVLEFFFLFIHQPLHDALSGDLSFHFKEFALLLIKSPWEVMAEALYHAMKGLGTKERVLNEIIGGISKDDVNNLKNAYLEGTCFYVQEGGLHTLSK